jgi:GNL3L/Grn1 putative GTPase
VSRPLTMIKVNLTFFFLVGKPKDPGIPNEFPYKDQLLAEMAEQRRIVSLRYYVDWNNFLKILVSNRKLKRKNVGKLRKRMH